MNREIYTIFEKEITVSIKKKFGSETSWLWEWKNVNWFGALRLMGNLLQGKIVPIELYKSNSHFPTYATLELKTNGLNVTF